MEDNKKRDEEELLKKITKAAEKGVNKANIKNILLSSLPTILLICLLAYLIVPKINALSKAFNSIFKIEESVEGHDLTINNHSIFGYTASDFEEAIFKDNEKLKKLEVYKLEISDATTITETGLLNLGIFTKNQLITYNGTVIYTVDLGNLNKSDIIFDKENKIITIKIPHAKQEEINIPEDEIQFGSTTGGLLAFGDIKMTVEESTKVQAGARDKMQQKLDEQKVIDTADRFAKLLVWEIYSPIIKSVAKDYSLEVIFK